MPIDSTCISTFGMRSPAISSNKRFVSAKWGRIASGSATNGRAAGRSGRSRRRDRSGLGPRPPGRWHPAGRRQWPGPASRSPCRLRSSPGRTGTGQPRPRGPGRPRRTTVRCRRPPDSTYVSCPCSCPSWRRPRPVVRGGLPLGHHVEPPKLLRFRNRSTRAASRIAISR